MLMLENDLSDEIEALDGHKTVFDPNNPRSLTNAASMPAPVASTISAWIGYPRVLSNDPAKIAFLTSLAD